MRTVELSDEAFATVCGMIQPSDEADPENGINHQGVFGPFEELREKFPLGEFEEAVERGLIDYDEEAGL